MNVSSTLTVRPDGSGTLTERLVLPSQFAQMMRSFQQMGDSAAAAEGLFTEEELRAKAESRPGLRLTSVTMLSDAEGEGYEAVYAFDDLNEIQFDPGPDDVLPENAPQTGEDGPLDLLSGVDLSFTPGSPATLTVRMPRDSTKGEADDSLSAGPMGEDAPTSERERRMMREMMKDAGFRLAVQVDGEIVETNATHRSGSTITLMEMDFGALVQDSTAFARMMSGDRPALSSRAALDSLNALPGLAVEPQETVTVRFQ